MIKYTATDIIKRAEQLADLENSDFISDSEKLALLNEAFQVMYQKIVNANERLFIKRFYVENGMCLPSDFYQLSSIYVESNKEPVSKTNNTKKTGYEIRNNRLYLSQEYKDVPVVFEYVPVPQTIFLKEKTIDSPFNETNILAVNKKNYLRQQNSTLIVGNIEDGDTYTVPGTWEVHKCALYDNAVMSREVTNVSGKGETTVYSFDKAETELYVDETSTKPVIYNNKLYEIGQNNEVVDLNGNTIGLKVPNIDIKTSTWLILTDGDIWYQICYDNKYFINTEGPFSIKSKDLTPQSVFCGNEAYVSFGSKISKLTLEGEKVIVTDNSPVGLVSSKYVLTKNLLSQKQYLEGLMDDSLIEYPNNIFYVLLAYKLAMAFKVKQSADVSGLTVLYTEAENQFYDSINRDNNSYYQINNVYRPNTSSIIY